MNKIAEFRKHAADCRELATKTANSEHQKMLLDMAQTWDELAKQRDQILGAVGAVSVLDKLPDR
jgi:hypothetical protein